MSDSTVMDFNADNEADVSRNIIKAFYNYQDPDEWVGLKIAYLNDIVLIGKSCYSNTFGYQCYSNTTGDYYSSNTIGDSCIYNTFGDGCGSNTFGYVCEYNTFGYQFGSNTIGGGCSSNTFGDRCHSNTVGHGCSSNTFGDRCHSNTVGDGCSSNTVGKYCYYNTFGDNCRYIDISAGTSSQIKRYYHVLDGVQGTDSSHISITGTNGNNFVTYVGMNSSGELKTWVPADLVQ